MKKYDINDFELFLNDYGIKADLLNQDRCMEELELAELEDKRNKQTDIEKTILD